MVEISATEEAEVSMFGDTLDLLASNLPNINASECALIAKVLSDKRQNLKVIKSTLVSEASVMISPLEQNTSLCNIGSKQEMDKIMEQRSWSAKGCRVVLKQWPRNTPPP